MENFRPEKGSAQGGISKGIVIMLVCIVLILGILIVFKPVYIMKGLGQQEMGVKIRAGEIVDIVGPGGIYNDVGLYVKMETYNIEGVWFIVSDEEVFTKDMQPVIVEIRGQVFRPTLTSVSGTRIDGGVQYFTKEEIARHFVNYRRIYKDDTALESQMNGFSRQAMKVCVGQNDLRGNAVAEGRDVLRSCIESELEKLTREVGMYVNNVVVTNVQASEGAMVIINETNQYLLDAQKAKAQTQKLEEEGKALAVQREAEIRVQQAAGQETARQRVTLAELEEKELIAQRAVLEAQRQNAIIEQQLNMEKAKAATHLAEADLAEISLLAKIYENNPAYYMFQVAQMNASALKATDKVLIVPEGTMPQIVIGSQNLMPTVPIQ